MVVSFRVGRPRARRDGRAQVREVAQGGRATAVVESSGVGRRASSWSGGGCGELVLGQGEFGLSQVTGDELNVDAGVGEAGGDLGDEVVGRAGQARKVAPVGVVGKPVQGLRGLCGDAVVRDEQPVQGVGVGGQVPGGDGVAGMAGGGDAMCSTVARSVGVVVSRPVSSASSGSGSGSGLVVRYQAGLGIGFLSRDR